MAGDNPMRAGAFLLALSFLLFGPLAAAAGDGRIVLEADRVEFDQASGFAVATGAVCISRDLLRVFAPRIEYSAVDNTIEAFSEPGGKKVVLFHGPQRLEGDHLALDMVSGEGLFRNASGGFPAEKGEVYASGSDVTTTRVKEGQRFGSIPGRVQKDLVTGDQVYQWRNVGFTTCPAENPHYQLVSKRLVVIPGFRLVASKPAVYIGGKFLLSYPFDYVIDLSNGSRSQFLPQVMYEGDKGVGVSYGAPLAMGDVNARWKAFLWSGVGLEPSSPLITGSATGSFFSPTPPTPGMATVRKKGSARVGAWITNLEDGREGCGGPGRRASRWKRTWARLLRASSTGAPNSRCYHPGGPSPACWGNGASWRPGEITRSLPRAAR